MTEKLTKDRFKMNVRVCLITGKPCYEDCRKCAKAIDRLNSIKKERE